MYKLSFLQFLILVYVSPILAGSTDTQKNIPAKINSQQVSLPIMGIDPVNKKIDRNDSKSINTLQNISIPERVQMIVNIIAIISAIYAFVKLFKKDRQQEKQINSITSLVKSQEDQLIELKKQNEIFQNQLNVTQKYYETDLSMKKNKIEKENKERMKVIRPCFKSSGNTVYPNFVELTLINVGQTAYKINTSFLKCTFVEFDDLMQMDKIVNNFKFALKGKIEQRDFKYIIRLEFNDDDGNRYYQILNGNRIHICEEEPVLISEKENINV